MSREQARPLTRSSLSEYPIRYSTMQLHTVEVHIAKRSELFSIEYIVQHAYRGSETMRWLQLPALLKAFGCIPGEHRLAFKLQKFKESGCHVVFNSRKKTNARTERRLKVLGLIFQDDEQNG